MILQSGGPTSVLNASLVGIIHEARNRFARTYGSVRGFDGLLGGNIIDLTGIPDSRLDRLARTPSAGLGTSRVRPSDSELDTILSRLDDLGVGAVVGIGGNDTADSLERLSRRGAERGAEVQVIGIPKTIDNDLANTDHSLGYPSAARLIAAFTRDALIDSRATANQYPVKFVEVMGRNAGWLAASGMLWTPEGLPLPLIVLPERPFSNLQAFLETVELRIERDGYVVIVVPETMRWQDGSHVAGATPEWIDSFNHPYFPSAGEALLKACGVELGRRGKLDRPGSVSRSSIDYASAVDLSEAEDAGKFAVSQLANGVTGACVVIRRSSSAPYISFLDLEPLSDIANFEFILPGSMIDDDNQPAQAFHDYAMPLVGTSTSNYEFLDLGS